MIVTSDSDGLIKIWNFNKKLIREIKFAEPISVVCFYNEKADLMAAHGGKMSRILADDYLPKSDWMHDEKEWKGDETSTRLDDYFLTLKHTQEGFMAEEKKAIKAEVKPDLKPEIKQKSKQAMLKDSKQRKGKLNKVEAHREADIANFDLALNVQVLEMTKKAHALKQTVKSEPKKVSAYQSS